MTASPRRHCQPLLLSFLLLASTTVDAQAPFFAQMLGRPLYQAQMSDGAATVRVIRKGVRDTVSGIAVELAAREGNRWVAVTTQLSAADGRAAFFSLSADKTYTVSIKVGDKTFRSQPFSGPKRGGVRLMLSTEFAPGNKATAVQSASPDTSNATDAPTPTAPTVHGGQPRVDDPRQSGAAKLDPRPDLPDGTILVTVVLGAKRKALAKSQVKLLLGDQTLQVLETDGRGEVRFVAPARPDKRPLEVAVRFAEISYRSQRLRLPDQGGLALTFRVFSRTRKADALRFGPGSHLLAAVGEGSVSFRQVLSIVNTGDHLFDAGKDGLELPVPRGATRTEVAEDQRNILQVREGRRVFLTRPVPPGRLTLQYFFQMPYEHGALEFSQRWPLASGRLIVIIADSSTVRLSGPTMETRRVERMGNDQRPATIFTLQAARAEETVEFTLSRLPTRDTSKTVTVLALAGLILLWGAMVGGRRRWKDANKTECEALMADLVALERDRQLTPDAEDYASRRAALLAQIRPLWSRTPTGNEGPAAEHKAVASRPESV